MNSNFLEKINGITFYLEQGEQLLTLDSQLRTDSLPISKKIIASLDLFNVEKDKTYRVDIELNDGQNQILIFTTHIELRNEDLKFKINDDIGKTKGSFEFILTVAKEGDIELIFTLLSKDNDILDYMSKYLSFKKDIPETIE